MTVELAVHGDFATITLNRPEALNALSFTIIRKIGEAIDAVAAKPEVRALFFTGAGEKAFCAGADIKELRNRSLFEQKRGAELGQSVFAKLDDLPVTSIALVNGYAFGGGLELALACTFRLASRKAKFGLPEIKLGLIPGCGGTQRLPRLVGESRALEMIMTGRTVDAEEALGIGLINRVVDGSLTDAGAEFAQSFCGYSLPVLNLARRSVQRALENPVHAGLRIEADLSTLAYQTADAEEGMAAFEQKRKAKFQDG
jgi:enoyl-CoA hydratase